MSAYDPPSIFSNIFNDSYFTDPDSSLSIGEADARYLKLSGGVVNGLCTFANGVNLLGSITYNAVVVDLSLLSGITLGIGQSNKLLSLDANLDVSNIRNITSSGDFNLSGNITLSGSNSHIYLTGSASGIDLSGNIGSSGNITLSGSNSHIYLTGSASGIDLNGINGNVSINGSGGHLNIENTESANSTGSQGAIKCQGGIYAGQNCYFNSTSQFNGILKVLDTTDSTALSTGSVQISGGCSISKTLYAKSQVIDNTLGGDLLILNTTSNVARCAIKFNTDTTNWLLSARASGVSDPNTFYIQNSGLYRMMMQTNGDLRLFSTTDSNSTFTTGALRIDGGLSVSKNINCFKNIITNNGNQLVLQTGSSPTDYSALIEVPGSGTLHMATTISGTTTHMTLGKGLWINNSGTGGSRGYPLDFGSTARDVIISLYATGLDDSSVYGIGAANSAMQFISPQSFSFINNSSSFPGNIRMYINSAGRMALGNSTSPACGLEVSNGTVRIQSQASPASGEGLELAYDPGADTANVYSFNRSTGAYHNLNLNDTMYLSGDRYIGVRTNSPICALDVRSSVTSSTLNSFGYLSSSGSGTASGFSNRPFSIRCSSGIRCDSGEIDVISDIRLKKNITTLDDSIVEKVLSLEAISFKYLLQPDEDPKKHHGFRAQDLVAKGLNCLCGFSDSDEPLEDMDIVCDDGSIAHLRGSQRLVMNLPEMIPVLQRALQMQAKTIDEQQEQIDFLMSENEANSKRIEFLIKESTENDKRIDELIDAIHDLYEELDHKNIDNAP